MFILEEKVLKKKFMDPTRKRQDKSKLENGSKLERERKAEPTEPFLSYVTFFLYIKWGFCSF
jgi:hypothetical protein